MFIRVRVGSARSCPTRPAEWNVDPLVSSDLSSTTTSRSPSSARWYATLAPPTPAPMTTTRADDGRPVFTRSDDAAVAQRAQGSAAIKGLGTRPLRFARPSIPTPASDGRCPVVTEQRVTEARPTAVLERVHFL